ncbi:integrase catalytic domain-containing protein [Trichonephila inaurata madagascariensis]|uniref:Integrase catalytic domain-containing protein n=1 Tax=Trichonephila inaurata madagascariensis TaxID=2747483 RepID=A0A8X7C7Z4_9ARAC|nr:integrase catalytic domain-containing protein [Trichonephila inaurata madagascariensis]
MFGEIQQPRLKIERVQFAEIRLVNIRPEDIVDGNPKLTLGLIWTIILHFQGCIQARAVLDSGSKSNVVTQDFANKLGAPQNRINTPISSLGGNKTTVKSKLNATIINGNSSFPTTLDFLVVSKITDFLLVSQINLNNLKISQELEDPNFGVPGKIDLLIGAEAFFDIIKEGIIRTSDNGLVFRRSVFGYIATGTTHSYKQNQYCGFISGMQNIDDNLQKFWEIETINEGQKPLSKEEEYCENHYQMTHTRNEAGRYVLQMPVKDIHGLGHSKDLGHMEKVEEHPDEISANNICYYLPHHRIFRPDKTTTKLRVVFNGSASTSGLSLNDLLLKGEVKEDIFEIMTRFRKHKYAFTTDIQMMFRQILIDPAQRDLLRIMWKTGANEEPVIYRLKTVTYGTASAPFLAIRTLKQLAMDEASTFPLDSKVALQDVYMDDVVSGAQNLDTARQLQCQLQNMLETCEMKLHKWNSNSKELLNSSTDQEHSFSTNAESAIKTLGVSWKPTGDYFMFKVSIPSMTSYTKRDVLSVIARLYDPLGLIGPVINKAKTFLQKYGLEKCMKVLVKVKSARAFRNL